MKENKQSSLGRILGCAGGHRRLTALGCLLSALSAVLGLVPYVCVWLAARTALAAWPDLSGVTGLERWGWTAVWFAVGSIALYFAALMCTHLAAFRTARNIRKAAMAHVLTLPLGFFTGNQSGRPRDGRRAAEAQGSSRGRQPALNGMTSPAALAPQGLRRAKRGLFRPL